MYFNINFKQKDGSMNVYHRNQIIKNLYIMVICCVLLFSGCSANNKDYGLNPKNPITITVWHYYNGFQKDIFNQYVQDFNQTIGKKKGIYVKVVSKSSFNNLVMEIEQSMKKEVGAPPLPNIFSTYIDIAKEKDDVGLLVDLEKYFNQGELEEYRKEYIEEGRIGEDNKLKVFPVAKSTEVMMLNGTDWNEFSKKTSTTLSDLYTWEGIVETSEKYYEYTDNMTPELEDGKSFFGRDALANYILVGSKQLGKEIFQIHLDGQKQVCLSKSVMKKLWDYYYIPYINGYFLSKGKFATDDAKTGDIISLVGSMVGVTYFPQEVVNENGDRYAVQCLVLPVPNFKGSKPYVVQQGAGMAITKTDERHEWASVIFLKWFTEIERNILFSIHTGYLPVKEKAYNLQEVNRILEKNKVTVSPIIKQTFLTGIHQMNQSILFSNKPINHSYEIRLLLEKKLITKAQKDREIVLQNIKNGMSREEAVAEFTAPENFEKWFRSLNQEIEVLLEGE